MLSKIAKNLVQMRNSSMRMSYGFCSEQKKDTEKQQQQHEQQQEEQQNQQQGGGRTAQPDQENENLQNKKEKINYGWQAWRVFVWGNLSLLAYNIYQYSSSKNPEEEIGVFYPYSNGAKYLIKEYNDAIDFFTKPPTKKLLQDIPFMPPGMDPPKTIVLNLTGTMIHSNYVFGKGTEVLKRPGLTKFLRALSQQFEVVIFTDDESMFTMELVQQLDPTQQIFSGRFGRESMVYDKGQYVKDLRYLNRDISRIIVIDKNPDFLKYHSDNGIYIPLFEGDGDDKELYKLLPFIQYLGSGKVKDVRKEIAHYGNYNPQDKFMEELKAKQESIQRKQQTGIQGIFRQGVQGGGQKQFQNFNNNNNNY